MRRLRWRTVTPGEVATVVARLTGHPDERSGPVRHMFLLSVLESSGPGALRIATRGASWAVAVVFPGRLVVPAGDPLLLERLGEPTRGWRLLVGDRRSGDAILAGADLANTSVHDQEYLVVDPDRVPDEAELPPVEARRATRDDLPALARLAVQLHVEDRYGPDPGWRGRRGYERRIGESVDRGLVWCLGPPGAPWAKLERSVSSRRWGVQLSGIVIDPEHRDQGIGRRLVATAVREALTYGGRGTNVTLHVRSDNDRALRAYDAAGFVRSEAWRVAVRR